jgi:prevent-host-death family protein
MVTVTLAHAKAHLSELLDKVENGEPFIITRHGRAVANVSAVTPPKQPLRSLAAFRAQRTGWRKSSAELLREMRDESL